MHSAIVISWFAMGCFVAWIATHLRKDRSTNPWIENLMVGVLGGLVGGFVTHLILGAVGARHGYNAFTWSTFGALVMAAVVIKLTRFTKRRRLDSHVS